MAYASKRGRRPMEYASKSAHSQVINDPVVRRFLKDCHLPTLAQDVDFDGFQRIDHVPVGRNPIAHIIAVDGGYDEIPVRLDFPSASICFFQFGVLTFSISDLESLGTQPFIDPDDIAKLKRIQRLRFTLPVRNVALKKEATLTNSVRRSIYDLFQEELDDSRLMESLRWLVFREYQRPALTEWQLASCPVCRVPRIPLKRAEMTEDHQFSCRHCHGRIYLTDILRLYEAVDDELGAGGILGYVTTAMEQLLLVHLIRLILNLKPALLRQILFIKDGPLAFFGQTANMHQPMRALIRFLFREHDLFLAGLEKSGAFVEHADEIANRLEPETVLLLNNDYIYKYIIPGKADPANPYGRTTYYGNKLIFKTRNGDMYVVTLPTIDINPSPTAGDFRNLDAILTNIEKLKCDMYDSALVPVALVNKLVSLANHPSSRILQRFAVETIGQ